MNDEQSREWRAWMADVQTERDRKEQQALKENQQRAKARELAEKRKPIMRFIFMLGIGLLLFYRMLGCDKPTPVDPPNFRIPQRSTYQAPPTPEYRP
jgi:hypothetical protein